MDMYEHFRARINHFSLLKDKEWEDFASFWTRVSFNKGEIVTAQGQVEKYFYFVHEGVLRGYQLHRGIDYSLGFSYNGDFSGVYDSFLDQLPAEWHLEAISDTDTLKISFQDLTSMFDKYKSVERWGRIFNSQMLMGMGRRQLELRSFTAEERFERLFNQSPHIFQLVSQKHLASYLGMTPETFSRMRRQKMGEDRT